MFAQRRALDAGLGGGLRLGVAKLFQKLDQFVLLHFLHPAWRQILERERAITRADQSADAQAKVLEHAANFAVLAFLQSHLDPHIGASAALQIGVDLAIADAVDLDPVNQFLQLCLRDRAIGARAITARNTGRGEFEATFKRAVGGHQQEPLGTQIEATDGHRARHIGRELVINRRAPFHIAFGSQEAGWLVIAEQPRRLRRGNRIAVNGNSPEAGHDGCGRFQRDTVNGDAAVLDHPLNLSPRRDSGAREEFGDALFILRRLGHYRPIRDSTSS